MVSPSPSSSAGGGGVCRARFMNKATSSAKKSRRPVSGIAVSLPLLARRAIVAFETRIAAATSDAVSTSGRGGYRSREGMGYPREVKSAISDIEPYMVCQTIYGLWIMGG